MSTLSQRRGGGAVTPHPTAVAAEPGTARAAAGADPQGRLRGALGVQGAEQTQTWVCLGDRLVDHLGRQLLKELPRSLGRLRSL